VVDNLNNLLYNALRIQKSMNIKAVLLASLIAAPIPTLAQQTNIYQTCTNYQENYNPGYYDRYGNYVQGNVDTQRYNVQCGTGTYYRPNNGGAVYQSPVGAPVQQPYYGRRYCPPSRTVLGGLLGGGAAAAIAKQDSWSWAIPLGAVLGTGVAQAGCY
jgi:hypothetical protein